MHFSTLVFSDHRLDQKALEELLSPWCHSSDRLIDPRYDFFVVGGRFQWLLDPDWSQEDPERLWAFSQKQVVQLALKRLQDRAVEHAEADYDAIHVALAGRRLPSFADLVRQYGERGWSDHYHADPAVQAAKSVAPNYWPESLLAFGNPRENVLDAARRRAILTHAIVAEGQWHEFEGFSFDEHPHLTREWQLLSDRLLAKARLESWLTVVDCHR